MLITKCDFVRLMFIVIFARNVKSGHEEENLALSDDNETTSLSYQQYTTLPEQELKQNIESISYHNTTEAQSFFENNSSRQQKSMIQFEDNYEDLMNTDLEETTANTVSLNGHAHILNDGTTQPTTKKAKQLEIYKTRPNELLRHYIEDPHLRPPIAALVDKKINPLTKARHLWNAVRPAASNLEVMLVSYDSEGN